jgi:succinate dehydrogenase / fumarate reductase cytochrome b subunit
MLRSSIAKKIVVAITGLLLFGYLIAHMAGNLLAFNGPSAINAYAEKLKETGPLLWVARLVLLTAFVIHIYMTILLTRENAAARPDRYMMLHPRRANFASLSMIFTGVVVLAFVGYHIAHFTLHWTNPAYAGYHEHPPNGSERHDVYRMVVDAFSNPAIVAFYVLALAVTWVHLSHGLQSLMQTLGLANRRYRPVWLLAGPIVAGAIVVGFLCVPIAVLTGYLKPTGASTPKTATMQKDAPVR